jgi:segregation and condensation protein A
MDVYDIKIAEITNQYLSYIELMEQLDLEVAGEFLVMAATLLNLKSRSLLPEPVSEEEQEAVDEILSTKELIRQLVEYRKFKEIAEELRQKQEEQSRVHYRDNVAASMFKSQQREPSVQDVRMLLDAFSRVIRYVEPKDYIQLGEERHSVEEKMEYVRGLLGRKQRLGLYNLFKECSAKQEIIVIFLALLELSRLGEIHLEQPEAFKDVIIQLRKPQEIDVGEE